MKIFKYYIGFRVVWQLGDGFHFATLGELPDYYFLFWHTPIIYISLYIVKENNNG